MKGTMLPKAQIPSATVLGKPVRLYQHPTVPNGRPWCSIRDMAALAGYTPDQAQEAATAWHTAYPELSDMGEDGAVAVSDAAVGAFLTFLDMMGVDAATPLRDSYDAETGRAWLMMTAHLPYAEWQRVAQRSGLADVLPDPESKTN